MRRLVCALIQRFANLRRQVFSRRGPLTTALRWLRRCACWSGPVLFTNNKTQFFQRRDSMKNRCLVPCWYILCIFIIFWLKWPVQGRGHFKSTYWYIWLCHNLLESWRCTANVISVMTYLSSPATTDCLQLVYYLILVPQIFKCCTYLHAALSHNHLRWCSTEG